MTGTSADGADLVLARNEVRGSSVKETLLSSKSYEFPSALRKDVLEAQKGMISLRDFGELQHRYSAWLANQIQKMLKSKTYPKSLPLILGIHGQTLWHDPNRGFSIQMLDPVLIGCLTGYTTVSQFRQADLALAGQGAPLVPYYHWLRFIEGQHAHELPISIHNIGGMSNFSFISKNKNDVLGFDVGPGNVLIDLAVAKATKNVKQFDDQGALARIGKIDWSRLEKIFSEDPYFKILGPKSTGREVFNETYLEKIDSGSDRSQKERAYDAVAQATAFTALTIVRTYERLLKTGKIRKLSGVSFCGGGAKNLYLMELIAELLKKSKDKRVQNIKVRPMEGLLGDPQSIEAMAFGRFALEVLAGRSVALPKVTGAKGSSAAACVVAGHGFPEILRRLRA